MIDNQKNNWARSDSILMRSHFMTFQLNPLKSIFSQILEPMAIIFWSILFFNVRFPRVYYIKYLTTLIRRKSSFSVFFNMFQVRFSIFINFVANGTSQTEVHKIYFHLQSFQYFYLPQIHFHCVLCEVSNWKRTDKNKFRKLGQQHYNI